MNHIRSSDQINYIFSIISILTQFKKQFSYKIFFCIFFNFDVYLIFLCGFHVNSIKINKLIDDINNAIPPYFATLYKTEAAVPALGIYLIPFSATFDNLLLIIFTPTIVKYHPTINNIK